LFFIGSKAISRHDLSIWQVFFFGWFAGQFPCNQGRSCDPRKKLKNSMSLLKPANFSRTDFESVYL
jgi:hypothetical protein